MHERRTNTCTKCIGPCVAQHRDLAKISWKDTQCCPRNCGTPMSNRRCSQRQSTADLERPSWSQIEKVDEIGHASNAHGVEANIKAY